MMKIELDREKYSPGDTIHARITLDLEKIVKARGVFAELYCIERKKTKTSRIMDQYDYDREHELGIPKTSHIENVETRCERKIFCERRMLGGEGEYCSKTYHADFTLPKNAKPTSHEYGHDGCIHVWGLSVKLDVPLMFDENDLKEIFVEGL